MGLRVCRIERANGELTQRRAVIRIAEIAGLEEDV